MAAVQNVECEAPSKEKEKKAVVPKKVEPQSDNALVTAMLPDILKEAGEAKGHSVDLRAYRLSTELVDQMESHSRFMYAIYRQLQSMTQTGADDLSTFQPYLEKLDKAQTWYKGRSKAVKAMARALPAEAAKQVAASC